MSLREKKDGQKVRVKHPTMPLFYFDGGYQHMGGLPSDRDWILSMLSVVPVQHRGRVCKEYEKLYQREKRESANKFLHGVAKKFNDEKSGDG